MARCFRLFQRLGQFPMSLDITRVIRIVPLGVVRLALVITLIFGDGPIDQHAAAGKLTIGSSPMGARVSSAM